MPTFSSTDRAPRYRLLPSLARLPLLAYRMLRWRASRGGWLPGYFRQRRFAHGNLPKDRPIEVMVLIADHFEPARRFGDAAAVASVQTWCEAYEKMAGRHRDADGRPPQHTWFYRYDYPNADCLQRLSESAFHGFGEVEFHLHHGHDSAAQFAATLKQGVEWFQRRGALRTAEPRPRTAFAYVAGNWALDNGAGDPSLSGCDTELTLLRQAGCYADFTFPALGSPAQPRKTNAIYYAAEDGKAKSYDTGVDVRVGGRASGDLLLFQGPLTIDWSRGRIEDGALEDSVPAAPERLANWLSAHVHVQGRPEWVFIKLHTHAVQSRSSFLGPAAEEMFTAMERCWNRPPFRLHYVTAREAYNLVRAAEAGRQGDPNDFRDFVLPPPANRHLRCSAPWLLRSCTAKRVEVELLELVPAQLQLVGSCALPGRFPALEVRYPGQSVRALQVDPDGVANVEPLCPTADGGPAASPLGCACRP